MTRIATAEETLGLEQLPPALTVKQAATLLGVSRQTVVRGLEAGDIVGVKVRGRWVVSTRPLAEQMGWM